MEIKYGFIIGVDFILSGEISGTINTNKNDRKSIQMRKILRVFFFVTFLPLLLFVGCDDDSCTGCGPGIKQGYLFKKVTEEDLATLGAIEGIELNICITYSVIDVVSEEIDTETVKIVDDCCCD